MEKTIKLGQREFTMEQIKNILSSRKLIEKPGKYQVKVSQVTEYTPEDGTPRSIINLQATTRYHVGVALEALKTGEYQKALNTNLTATVFYNEGVASSYVPTNGEIVNVIVSEITNKNGEQILVVSSMHELPVINAKSTKDLFAVAFKDELDVIAEEAKVELNA